MRRPDSSVRPLLFDGSPLLPSAVFADPDGRMLVGQDAERGARLDPARFEPNPKRRINDLEILLGDRTFSMVDLVAATLRRVAGEAVRVAGGPVSEVTTTYPAEWGQARRRVLLDAAGAAGLGRVTLVPEPVAAASYFATVLRHRVPTGSCVVVYDLGAGTFDASVVRHDPDGLDTLTCRGVDDFGGVDLDAVLVDLIGDVLKVKAPEAWARMAAPATAADRRHRRMLWDDARQARETAADGGGDPAHAPLARHRAPARADAPGHRRRGLRGPQPVGKPLDAAGRGR
jgi:molecular chaperone DnaK (HSP70)